MAHLAIIGHATRGKEVIEILEMLGGSNPHTYSADCDSLCFYIGKCTDIIYYDWVNNCYEDEDILVFTLEEFLEKFPYKIGDKVNSPCKGCIKPITSMKWDTYLNTVTYKLDNKIYTNIDQLKAVNDLQPCKQETMDRKYNVEEYLKVWEETEKGLEVVVNDRFELKEDNGKFYIIKTQPKYPKTYEECCKMLGYSGNYNMILTTDVDNKLFNALYRLKVCRDTYWKIAGEQMGMGKPWMYDMSKDEFSYAISYQYGYIQKIEVRYKNVILAFPTAEMRDAFYDNFKQLIETCKEFL